VWGTAGHIEQAERGEIHKSQQAHKHFSHFYPQQWLLCHMCLYYFKFKSFVSSLSGGFQSGQWEKDSEVGKLLAEHGLRVGRLVGGEGKVFFSEDRGDQIGDRVGVK
jgi:hypothetical protein